MTTDTKIFLENIIESIQNRKGKNIVIANLTQIEDTICDYFIVCEGGSSSQVASIVESIRDEVKQKSGEAPLAIEGFKNAEWVAMDYANVMVHVFLPETREFYNLETLWADAKLKTIPNLD